MAILPFMVRLPGQPGVEFRQELVSEIETHIDRMLSLPNSAMMCYRVFDDGPAYSIKFPASLSDEEDNWLKAKYVAAGWKKVEVFTDFDSTVANRAVTVINLFIPT